MDRRRVRRAVATLLDNAEALDMNNALETDLWLLAERLDKEEAEPCDDSSQDQQ